MRVTVNTADEFCSELEQECQDHRVWQKIVRFQVNSVPEQREQISFEIQLWLTVLIDTDDGQYVLEYAESVGSNEPRRNDDAGSRAVAERLAKVKEVCDRNKLQLRPGKIEAF